MCGCGGVGKMRRTIEISYQPWDESGPKHLTLSEEDYYDSLEPGDRSYAQDGVAKYQEPHRYLAMDATALKWLVVTEPCENGWTTFRYQYFDGLASYMVHSTWPDGSEEILHSVNVSAEMCHITRTLKEADGQWATVMNSLVPHGADDSSAVIEKTGNWTWEECKGFGCVPGHRGSAGP